MSMLLSYIKSNVFSFPLGLSQFFFLWPPKPPISRPLPLSPDPHHCHSLSYSMLRHINLLLVTCIAEFRPLHMFLPLFGAIILSPFLLTLTSSCVHDTCSRRGLSSQTRVVLSAWCPLPKYPV